MTEDTGVDIERAKAAWAEFCRRLQFSGESLLNSSSITEALDVSEALRYLTRMTRTGLEQKVEADDPRQPRLISLCNETIKVYGENPDNDYFLAPIDHRYEYILEGKKGDETYFVATAVRPLGTPGDGAIPASINSETMTYGEDGRFTIHIAANPAGPNRIELRPGVTNLLVRFTRDKPATPHPSQITIRRVDEGDCREVLPLVLENMESAIEAASDYIDWSVLLPMRESKALNTGMVLKDNELHFMDRKEVTSEWGDTNIVYGSGTWFVDEDEALIIRFTPPSDCTTWNFQLCNIWLESLDYSRHQIHLNSRSATIDRNGQVVIVVANEDPGCPNWLNTTGHKHGYFIARFVAAKAVVATQIESIKLSEYANA